MTTLQQDPPGLQNAANVASLLLTTEALIAEKLEKIFSRKDAGRFPEIKKLKPLVRDRVAPGRDVGHVDR